MTTLNLGILAHVDAGKTSLTERLLYAAGVTTHLGRVDAGDTIAFHSDHHLITDANVGVFMSFMLTVPPAPCW